MWTNWKPIGGRLVKPEDTVVVAGDVSWAMGLEQSLKDFQFIESLPGRKIILKGNHDYWWSTKSKMEQFFAKHGLDSLQILHNNSIAVGQAAVCGSRGWLFEQGEAHDQKIVAREAARLDASLSSAGRAWKKWPSSTTLRCLGRRSPLRSSTCYANTVRRCYYGHIHGSGCRYALNGTYLGIEFRLISADFFGSAPWKSQEKPNKS